VIHHPVPGHGIILVEPQFFTEHCGVQFAFLIPDSVAKRS
jgi:hypothetical protein